MHVHFDCFSGISGDMTLAALVDLGVPVEWLRDRLGRVLPPDDFDLTASPVQRGGIRAMDVQVRVRRHEHARHFTDIREMILGGGLPETVQKTSLEMFQRIAEAEAGIHGCRLEEVHFHEVGAVDAMVDIIGTALGVDYLGIASISSSPVALGSGFVECRHGLLPVPAPATLKILEGLPVYGTSVPHELATPTGAAIVATLAAEFGPLPDMTVARTGYGAGKRELRQQPNLLRLVAGKRTRSAEAENGTVVIETTIDDMNPELFGFVMNRLFEDGALDVCWIPVQMKKNRPGTLVQVLSRQEHRAAIVQRLLSETSTTGVRYHEVRREKLARELRLVETSLGRIQVKAIVRPDGGVRLTPEYEVCREIAQRLDLPLQEVYRTILKEVG
ncbi:MAG: nickel pincer cofactor biosynthesis protein LarC [Thermodesulfobacteriota bacterium]